MANFNHRRVLVILNYVLNSASIIGGILTAAIILGTMCLDRKIMNRVSLRFTLAVAIVDVAKAIAILAITKIHEDSEMCTLVALLTHWLTLVYLLLNTCVVLNLQLILVHGWVPGKKFEKFLWAAALLIPTVLMSIGQATGKYGLDKSVNLCDMRDPLEPTTNLVAWTTFLAWAVGAVVYCIIAIVLVTLSLLSKVSILERISLEKVGRHRRHSVRERTQQLKNKLYKTVHRILLFCVIPVVTQTGYLVMRVTLSYTNAIPLYLNYVSVIGTGNLFFGFLKSDLPGVLNLIALLIDPAFDAAISAIKIGRKKKFKPLDGQAVIEIHRPVVASTVESPPQGALAIKMTECQSLRDLEAKVNLTCIGDTTRIPSFSDLSSCTTASLVEKL